MKKQCVVRTAPTEIGYWYDSRKMKYLQEKLDDGWHIVICNPIGKDLEYILEKDDTDEKILNEPHGTD